MIRDSLDLQGDEDLEDEIEAAFDVRFTEDELMGMVTVGAIHDVINARLPERPGACETSMAFYRLRRALVGMGMTERIRPGTRLPATFSVQTNVQIRTLAKASGLTLPPMEAGPLVTGCLLLGAGAIILFLVGLTFNMALLGWLSVAAVVVAAVLAKLDRGRLPASLSTVGALARRTAPLNFGRLVKEGARVNSTLTWQMLSEVIADVMDISKDQIGRETLIYPPKKAAA